ncbi:adhesion G-protein coupled receptor G4 isoform X2 [Stegostoma tigrinum]|uniref:adhesion G-protein coupled receptor G4 isoform X2 n=1 Tax=Stegostoma tigrinum TaxID=3053191 RepID=UPI0028703028|nr:adhesion G-protein coupled receptor G4 isoform X2 [Stegostoma tigrinum]
MTVFRMTFCESLQNFSPQQAFHWLVVFGIFNFIQHHLTESVPMNGQKAMFDIPSKYGSLSEGVEIPVLTELTVCVDIYPTSKIKNWAAFTYHIAATGRGQELAITSQNSQLTVWLCGTTIETQASLPLTTWHTVCFTWSESSNSLTVYLNGSQIKAYNTSASRVQSRGSLFLGRYQLSNLNSSKIEFDISWNFLGDLYYFRVWNHSKSALEISTLGCSDGDIISWSAQHLNFTSNTLAMDSTLRCASADATSTPKPPSPTDLITSPTLAQRTTSSSTHSGIIASSSPPSGRTTPSSTSSGKATSSLTPSGRTTPSSPPSGRTTPSSTSSGRTTSSLTPSGRTTPSSTSSGITASSSTASGRTSSSSPPSGITTLTALSQIFTSLHATSVTVSSLTMSPVSSAHSGIRVCFFKTTMLFSCTVSPRSVGVYNVRNITERWLNTIFSTEELLFLDLTVESMDRYNAHSRILIKPSKVRKKIQSSEDSRYNCTFRLQATSRKTTDQIKQQITERLINQSYQESKLILTAHPDRIHICTFDPGSCPRDPMSTDEGDYIWPSISPVNTVQLNCVRNAQKQAERKCKLGADADQAEWSKPNLEQCRVKPTLPNSIQGMETIPITAGNVEDVARHLLNLIGEAASLSPRDVEIVVSKTTTILDVAIIDLSLGKVVVEIIHNILNKTDDLTGFSVSILQMMETLGNNLEFGSNEVTITTDTISMAMVNIDFIHFWGIAFGVLSYIDGFVQEIYMNKTLLDNPVAFIELPPILHKWSAGKQHLKSRIQFQFYGETSLFEDRTLSQQKLNSYVVSSSVKGKNVLNLSEPVKVTLKHLTVKQDDEQVTCVFWDFKQNYGVGGWSSSGCEVVISKSEYTTCYCNHLTHFGVLLNVSRKMIDPVNGWILTIISYIGCGVSSLFLGLILLTYISFENVRRDYPSKILMNLCMSLFMLNIFFLTNSWMASFKSPGLCITVAALMHYFLLSSFSWMCIEAVHMYFALVKVFNIYIRHYMLKFCLIGWGFPVIVVGLLLSINVNFYGYETKLKSSNPADMFCWLRNGTAFYLSVVVYFGLVFLINLAMFIVVLRQVQAMRIQRLSGSTLTQTLHHLKSSVSLTILLGLTWGFAFFAWGPAQVTFTYFFTIFNSLQGLFIFVFHCLMKDNVRTQWRIHLCCGPFQLSEYSEWSRTATNGNLKDGRTSFSTQSKKSSNSNSTTTSSNGSQKNLIPSPNFANNPDYSNDYAWPFDVEKWMTSRDIERNHKLPSCTLPHGQPANALYMNPQYTHTNNPSNWC